MPDNNQRHLPKMLKQGRLNRSQDAKPPGKFGGRGSIITNFQDVKWTPKKLALVIAALSIPYLIVITGLIKAGYIIIVLLMIGFAILTGLIYLALRWIEKSDF